MTIEQLEALERDATAVPWRWSDKFKTRDNDETWSLLGGGGYGILSCDGFGNSPQMCNKHDAELIVEMRESFPHLLAVAKAAQKSLDQLSYILEVAHNEQQDEVLYPNMLSEIGTRREELREALYRLEAQ